MGKAPARDQDVHTSTRLPRVAKIPMVLLTIRISRSLRDAANEKAAERNETVSDIVREALERYVKRR